jgi:hypothetical protein
MPGGRSAYRSRPARSAEFAVRATVSKSFHGLRARGAFSSPSAYITLIYWPASMTLEDPERRSCRTTIREITIRIDTQKFFQYAGRRSGAADSVRHENVPQTPAGYDKLRIVRIGFDLFPQAADVNEKVMRTGVLFRSVEMFQQEIIR